jgi:hypothetical protein
MALRAPTFIKCHWLDLLMQQKSQILGGHGGSNNQLFFLAT